MTSNIVQLLWCLQVSAGYWDVMQAEASLHQGVQELLACFGLLWQRLTDLPSLTILTILTILKDCNYHWYCHWLLCAIIKGHSSSGPINSWWSECSLFWRLPMSLSLFYHSVKDWGLITSAFTSIVGKLMATSSTRHGHPFLVSDRTYRLLQLKSSKENTETFRWRSMWRYHDHQPHLIPLWNECGWSVLSCNLLGCSSLDIGIRWWERQGNIIMMTSWWLRGPLWSRTKGYPIMGYDAMFQSELLSHPGSRTDWSRIRFTPQRNKGNLQSYLIQECYWPSSSHNRSDSCTRKVAQDATATVSDSPYRRQSPVGGLYTCRAHTPC